MTLEEFLVRTPMAERQALLRAAEVLRNRGVRLDTRKIDIVRRFATTTVRK